MTRNQLHGKKFEDWIKACGLFSGSADAGRSVTARFDIEARFDKKQSLPTSIKATGNKTVALSDARGFWELDESIRMIVGCYRQSDERKTFTTIHEFLLTAGMLNTLRGAITSKQVRALHDGISTSHFPVGHHVEAREWAKAQKTLLHPQRGTIILNPKIDSKSQRRIQCSISLVALIEICELGESHWCHTERMGEFSLPVELFSTARELG